MYNMIYEKNIVLDPDEEDLHQLLDLYFVIILNVFL